MATKKKIPKKEVLREADSGMREAIVLFFGLMVGVLRPNAIGPESLTIVTQKLTGPLGHVSPFMSEKKLKAMRAYLKVHKVRDWTNDSVEDQMKVYINDNRS